MNDSGGGNVVYANLFILCVHESIIFTLFWVCGYVQLCIHLFACTFEHRTTLGAVPQEYCLLFISETAGALTEPTAPHTRLTGH